MGRQAYVPTASERRAWAQTLTQNLAQVPGAVVGDLWEQVSVQVINSRVEYQTWDSRRLMTIRTGGGGWGG